MHSVAVAAALFFVLPFVFVFLTSVMSDDQALSGDLWPHDWHWANYATVFGHPGFLDWWNNSLLYAGLGTAVHRLLVRSRSPTRSPSSASAAANRADPGHLHDDAAAAGRRRSRCTWSGRSSCICPGTLWPLIIPMAFGDAYSIFLLRQFLLTIPQEYIDSARVDGCGELRTLLRIIVPMARPGIAAVALFQFFYCWNDYFGPQIYAAQNPASWTLSYGLESFKGAHSVNWNLTMAATLLVMAPVIIVFFFAQKAFVEGVTLTGVKGCMKLAVVGGGSTYTPELIDGFARLRDTLPVERTGPRRPGRRPAGAGRRAGPADLRQAGPPGPDRHRPSDLDAGVDGADAVLLQLRVGGQAARNQDETWPLECGCVGQETTGAGGLAKALRTVPVVLDIAERVRRAQPGRLDRRLHQPGRHRHPGAAARPGTGPSGCATSRSASSASSPRCSASRPAEVDAGPRRPQPPHLGARRARRPDGEDVLPKLLAEHGDAIADDLRMPRDAAATGSASSRRTTCATSTRTTRSYGSCAPSRRGPRRSPRSSASCWTMYARPGAGREAGAAGQRGGAFYSEAAVDLAVVAAAATAADVQVVNTLNDGTLPFLPDDAVIEVPAAVGRARARRRCRCAPLEPLYAGLIAHVTAYEDLALEAALQRRRATGSSSALLAHPLIGQIDVRRAADRPADRAQPGAPARGR